MNLRILNRDFQHPADGWYQIEAKGEHPNRAAGVVQVVDDEATRSIVNRFNADAGANRLRHGNELLIDHEHFSDQANQESRAYGWLQELQNRADGVYGRIRWTATGKAAVDGGDYRFFSTEYDPADLKVLNTGKSQRVRPLALAGLSLTNMNNNRGQKPITNRADLPPPPADGDCPDCDEPLEKMPDGSMKCPDCGKAFAGAGASADNTKNKQPRQNMKLINAELGLSAEAEESAGVAEIRKLKNRVTTLEPLDGENTRLKTENQTLLGEQCDALLDAHGVKDGKVRNRLKPVIVGLKDRADRVAALIDFGFKPVEPPKPGTGTQQTVLRNRDTKPYGATATAADTEQTEEEQKATALKIKNRAQELKGAAPSRLFESCWAQAKSEIVSGAK